jgi:2-dehydro-3-deoxygluconokinase
MKNIFLFGECMIELMTASQDKSSNTLKQSFAGDVFNTAVYLKRTFPEVKVSLVTAVGKDNFSLDMIKYFESENIDTDLVFQSETKIPGLYSIQLDDQGERSFTYWRENSAARTVMDFIDEAATEKLTSGDLFFFSGISLAVIKPEARANFWQKLRQLKAAGVKIVFDPNYRARMWKDKAETIQAYEQAFKLADIALPGVEDLDSLYGITSVEGVIEFCQSFSISELVIKNGPASVITILDGEKEVHQVKPVETVVDTTSAGDSFNGVYLGARIADESIADAVSKASKSAGFVIQHKGAIAPKVLFNEFVAQL